VSTENYWRTVQVSWIPHSSPMTTFHFGGFIN
jgi:hypothetical protein